MRLLTLRSSTSLARCAFFWSRGVALLMVVARRQASTTTDSLPTKQPILSGTKMLPGLFGSGDYRRRLGRAGSALVVSFE